MSRSAPAMAAAGTASAAPRLGTLVGATLLIAGVGVVGATFVDRPEPVAEVPFSERIGAAPASPALDGLAALLPGEAPDLVQLELVARPTGAVAATATLARRPGAPPVLLGWRSGLAEPVLYPEIDPAEELQLASALRRHLPEGALLLALPERSRRLAALTGARAPLAAADDTAALYVPEPWWPSRGAIRAGERARFALEPSGPAQPAFEALLDALLSPVAQGAARLQVLAQVVAAGAPCYLVLHLIDAFAVGLVRPEAVAIGLHDFPAGGALHDSVRLAKTWIRSEGHAAYAALPREGGVLRLFFLPRQEDTGLLLAHLLPFDRADLGAVPALRLVFQHRGYWVYRIEPVAASAENS